MPYAHIVHYRDPLKPSHGFHFLMTVLTLGCWLPIWVAVTVIQAFVRAGRTITEVSVRVNAQHQQDVFWQNQHRQALPNLHNPAWDGFYAAQLDTQGLDRRTW